MYTITIRQGEGISQALERFAKEQNLESKIQVKDMPDEIAKIQSERGDNSIFAGGTEKKNWDKNFVVHPPGKQITFSEAEIGRLFAKPATAIQKSASHPELAYQREILHEGLDTHDNALKTVQNLTKLSELGALKFKQDEDGYYVAKNWLSPKEEISLGFDDDGKVGLVYVNPRGNDKPRAVFVNNKGKEIPGYDIKYLKKSNTAWFYNSVVKMPSGAGEHANEEMFKATEKLAAQVRKQFNISTPSEEK